MDKIKAKLKELGLSDEQVEQFIKETINDKFIPKQIELIIKQIKSIINKIICVVVVFILYTPLSFLLFFQDMLCVLYTK